MSSICHGQKRDTREIALAFPHALEDSRASSRWACPVWLAPYLVSRRHREPLVYTEGSRLHGLAARWPSRRNVARSAGKSGCRSDGAVVARQANSAAEIRATRGRRWSWPPGGDPRSRAPAPSPPAARPSDARPARASSRKPPGVCAALHAGPTPDASSRFRSIGTGGFLSGPQVDSRERAAPAG